MDLLKLLDEELSKKHLTEFEKVRYIYLRTCELFSFDAKYNSASLFDENLYNAILNRKIDIRNVNNFLVVCHSYSDALIKLIRELTTAQVELHQGAHSYVYYYEKDYTIWHLDATYGDMSRVKLNLGTYGFSSGGLYSREKLIEIDETMGYQTKSKLEYLKEIDVSSKEAIFKSINILLKNSKCKKEFSDALFFVEWLLLGINCCEYNNSTYVGEDFNFHEIFSLPYNEELFCLSRSNNGYELKTCGREEALRLTRNLKTKNDILNLK